MHSKKSDPSDIEAFMKAWNNQVRVLKYHIVFQVDLRTSTMWIFFVWMHCIVIYSEYHKNANYSVMEQRVSYLPYLKFEPSMRNLIKSPKLIWKKNCIIFIPLNSLFHGVCLFASKMFFAAV